MDVSRALDAFLGMDGVGKLFAFMGSQDRPPPAGPPAPRPTQRQRQSWSCPGHCGSICSVTWQAAAGFAPIEVLVRVRTRSSSANHGPALGTAEAYVTSSRRLHTNLGSALGAFRIGSGGRMQRPVSHQLRFCLRCVLHWQGPRHGFFATDHFTIQLA